MVKQVGSAWKKVFRLSLPNDFLRKATSVETATLTRLVPVYGSTLHSASSAPAHALSEGAA